ncbi:MAG: hypothetical protein P0Y62_03655 [Candidatus Chryseobacterium colombiense]|nr:hypothetical protein [Chryseobacterium sp.]WEK70654.1 MAG: hypothetical protein P0Y62_03655 [Chryseobacterium sp.]
MKIINNKYQNLFKVYEILLKKNVIDIKSIIDWADKVIDSPNGLDHDIIELATGSRNISDVISILNCNAQNFNIEVVSRAVIGILSNLLETENVNMRKVSLIINEITYYKGLTDLENTFLYGYGDFYDLALQKIYGDLELISKEIKEFISFYKGFHLENYEDWEQINKNVKEGLPENLELLKVKYYS